MKTRYFVVQCKGQLFGLFQSNHEGATNFQINQLLKNADMVIKEVEEDEYSKFQEATKKKFG